jgi:uncharacterized protein DUF4439
MSTGLASLQAALAGEHAAVYAYGVIGGRSGGRDERLAAAAYVRHRARRDRLTAIIHRAGGRPVVAQPAYALPFAVDDRRQLHRLARLVERRCARLYADVVPATQGATRDFAARAISDCATTALAWGGRDQAFPGYG